MDATAVHFGAGSIGRGFIGEVLDDSGYDIVFLEVSEEAVDQINETHSYELHMLAEDETVTIDGVRALSPIEDEDAAVEALRRAALVTTSVHMTNLDKVAPLLAQGLRARLDDGAPKVNVFACENGVDNSATLRDHVLDLDTLSEDEVDQAAAFANTVVDRIVLDTDGDGVVDVAPFFELVIERPAMVDPDAEPIDGAVYAESLPPYVERKLYCFNCGHAWTAYVGGVKGYDMLLDAIQDEELQGWVREAMHESAAAIAERHRFDDDELSAYVDKTIDRFLLPGVGDQVDRVGRSPIRKIGPDERLTGPASACEELGLPNDRLLQGIAAALLHDDPDDEESVELQQHIDEHGVGSALQTYAGLEPGSRMHDRIVELVEGGAEGLLAAIRDA